MGWKQPPKQGHSELALPVPGLRVGMGVTESVS